ncbi:hypothetical protein ADN01_14645 [Levilinea saccharolytica]|uniref:Pyrrolo-quinoline quinone repeat domain-containing protein n=2 Tax=Levilinea saccharolytica TaxID=229921 RepID=A0A0P6X5Z1_9CHLR|nr:hypothetical protein ADN01_14645 [Levilinea saccharolytica]
MSAKPAVLKDILLLPFSEGQEIGGIHLRNGKLLWRINLQVGYRVRSVISIDRHFLVSICDERPLEIAQSGFLAVVDPATGQMSTLWEGGSSIIGQAVPLDDRLLLRTGANELILFEFNESLHPIWKQALMTWWSAAEPVLAGENILISDGKAMLGEGLLSAYRLSDGEQQWQLPTLGLLPYAPRVIGKTFLYQEGRTTWIARDVNDGKEQWRRNISHAYTPLELSVNGSETIAYSVVRGSKNVTEAGRYQLLAIDTRNGETCWAADLPARPRHLCVVDPETLLLFNDDGSLLTAKTKNGQMIWHYRLGSDEDPLRTEPFAAEGITVAGTRSGKIAAVWLKPNVGNDTDPRVLLQNGDHREAAHAYALHGDFLRAAEIFETNLGEPQKAILLYQHAGDYKRAGELALRQELYEDALRCFKHDGDLEAQARVFLAKGDELTAAEYYEKSNDIRRAAELFEHSGDPARARDLYAQLGDEVNARRVAQKMPPDLDNINWFVKANLLSEAANLAEQAGYLDRAVQLYCKANLPEQEMAVLRRLVNQQKPDRWSMERLADLLRTQGSFEEEARIRSRLCVLIGQGETTAFQQLTLAAADAWYRAACQCEDAEADHLLIAELYETAMHSYQQAYEDERQEICWQKVIFHRRLPRIMVEGQARQVFEEGAFNHITLTVINDGYGIATDIDFKVNPERFDLDIEATTTRFSHLAPDKPLLLDLVLRPKIGLYGNVPLILYWTWKDLAQRVYNARQTTYVRVKSKDESTGVDHPAQIFVNGTYIQTQNGHVEMVGGDKVESGGQKGDKVVVSRGSSPQIEVDQKRSQNHHGDPLQQNQDLSPKLSCPQCKLSIDPGAKHCWGCGMDLTGLVREE